MTKHSPHPSRLALLVATTALAVIPAGAGLARSAPSPHRVTPGEKTRPLERVRVLATAAIGEARLELQLLPGGQRALALWPLQKSVPTRLLCGDLEGAWGLWVTDVNGDGQPDLVIPLLKKARFDPVLANRLHVYTLVGGQCVPLWRGTRLAGRFTEVRPEGPLLFALESAGRDITRLSRYRWAGFGYRLERVLWQGRNAPPEALTTRYLSPAKH